MTATIHPPRWWEDYEVERNAARCARDQAASEREYRVDLTREHNGDIRAIAREIDAAMADTSELSPGDYASLRGKALALATLFGAIAEALRSSEGCAQ